MMVVSLFLVIFLTGVSALSAHLTQAEYQKTLNSTPSNGNISDKAKWINTEALDDASSKIDDVMIEARNSGMVLEGGSETKAFDIVEYGDKTPGLENHHGVLDVWATHNIDGYKSRASKSTTIALTNSQHDATKSVYRDWLFEKTGKRVGGKVDWKTVSAQEIQSLSERMFDAANVPMSARRNYYSEFNKYIYGLEK